MAPKIVALMPPHLHYVEPYAGGLSVLLAKNPEGVSEVANDINRYLSNFWHVLSNPACFAEFLRIVQAVPFSEDEWLGAEYQGFRYRSIPVIDDAVKFFVRCRQSLAGRMTAFAPLSRTRVRRGMNEQASAWLTAVEGLPAVHERLKRVVILNRDALDVISQQDGPQTLYYLDPPYLHETRASKDTYDHEMSEEDHRNLLHLLPGVRGRWLLSGYRSHLYDRWAAVGGYRRIDFDLPNNAAGGDVKRRMVECVWCNY